MLDKLFGCGRSSSLAGDVIVHRHASLFRPAVASLALALTLGADQMGGLKRVQGVHESCCSLVGQFERKACRMSDYPSSKLRIGLVLTLALLASLFFAAPADATTYSGTPHCVVGVPSFDALNLRSGPGVGHPIIAEMPPGSCRTYVNDGRSGPWFQVTYDAPRGPIDGWAHSAYLAPAITPPTPPIYPPPIDPPPIVWPPVPGPELCVDAPHHLNMRTGPSIRHRVIARVFDQSCGIVPVGPLRGQWLKVQLDSGSGPIGWMQTSYLRPADIRPPRPYPIPQPVPPYPPPPELTCVSGTPGRDSLNLRRGPSTRHGVIASMPHGSCALIVDTAAINGWRQVNFRGMVGWAYGAYLRDAGRPVLVLD